MVSQAGVLNAAEIPFPPGDIPIEFVTNSGTAMASANILQVKGGSGVTVSAPGSSNLVLITVTGTGFTWNLVNSTMNNITLVAENGYIAQGAGVVNFVLPPAAAVGDTFWIKGHGNLWTLTQNAGQFVSIGNVSSTPGVFGSITATMISDAVQLLCVDANTEFTEIGIQGNIKLV